MIASACAGQEGGGDAAGGSSSAASATDLEGKPRWTLRVDPLAGYLSPGGKFKTPATVTPSQDLDMERLNLDSPRLSAMGEVEVGRGKWFGGIRATDFSASDRRTTTDYFRRVSGDVELNRGDPLRSSLDLTVIDAEFGRTIWEKNFASRSGLEPASMRLEGAIGARLFDYDFSVEVIGEGTPTAGGTFLEPNLGVRVLFEYGELLDFGIDGSFGYLPGDQQTWSWDLGTSVTYTPVENFGVRAGYRIVTFDLVEGDGVGRSEFRGSLAGLYAGVSLRLP